MRERTRFRCVLFLVLLMSGPVPFADASAPGQPQRGDGTTEQGVTASAIGHTTSTSTPAELVNPPVDTSLASEATAWGTVVKLGPLISIVAFIGLAVTLYLIYKIDQDVDRLIAEVRRLKLASGPMDASNPDVVFPRFQEELADSAVLRKRTDDFNSLQHRVFGLESLAEEIRKEVRKLTTASSLAGLSASTTTNTSAHSTRSAGDSGSASPSERASSAARNSAASRAEEAVAAPILRDENAGEPPLAGALSNEPLVRKTNSSKPMVEIHWQVGSDVAQVHVSRDYRFDPVTLQYLQSAFDLGDDTGAERFETVLPAVVQWAQGAQEGRVLNRGRLRAIGT
jgi:hypothetical protein